MQKAVMRKIETCIIFSANVGESIHWFANKILESSEPWVLYTVGFRSKHGKKLNGRLFGLHGAVTNGCARKLDNAENRWKGMLKPSKDVPAIPSWT